jgi:hypothetical protein
MSAIIFPLVAGLIFLLVALMLALGLALMCEVDLNEWSVPIFLEPLLSVSPNGLRPR